MKKIFLFLFFIILCCFLIPILFTMQFSAISSMANVPKTEEKPPEETTTPVQYDYKQYNVVKLLHTKTGEIEEIKLDEYLYGVVSAEMPADFHIEALKAQAVVARTYTMHKILNNGGKHGEASICDDSACCQAWISKEDRLAKWEEADREWKWNNIVTAVNETAGKIIVYDGQPINAFFHASSGGTTEMPINVWGGSGYPYLQVVTTAGEDAYGQYSSEVELTKEQVIDKIKETHSDVVIDFNEPTAIQILEYTDSGRIKTMKFGNINLSGVEVRKIFNLRSAKFSVEILDDLVKFSVIGYGHGVGMSQTGADALAKEGKTFSDIINHYYVGVQIIDM